MWGKTTGVLVLVAASMTGFGGTASAHPGDGTNVALSCDIVAPFQSKCTTGPHTFTTVFGIGFADAGGYVGRGANVLGWSGGTATLDCLFAGTILFATCKAEGVPPPPGEPFNNTCKSEGVLMTPAAGTLRCVLSHD